MKKLTSSLVALGAILLLSSCGSNDTEHATIPTNDAAALKGPDAPEYGRMKDMKAAGEAPAWPPEMKTQMQAVIEKLQSFGDRPIPGLTAQEARKNHTPAD